MLLKIFYESINEQEEENAAEELESEEESQSEKDNYKSAKKISTKDATASNARDRIAADFNNILAFLQAVALKAPRVQAAPLSLQAYKRATGWFRQWADINLKFQVPPNKAASQDHSVLTGVFSEVATYMQNKEALCPVAAAQHEADREMHGWDHLPPTSRRVILTPSAADGLTILSAPPPSIHCFLNTRNATELQADCALTYSGNNIFLSTGFYQTLLQVHILAIIYPNTSTSLYLIPTTPSSVGPENAQQRATRVQVLLAMGHDRISREKAGELLDQRIHVVAMTQEIHHITRNFVRMTEDYLRTEGPLSRAMATWPRQIDHFECQYDKAFAGHCLFGADIVYWIHKQVKIFLHSCNTTSMEDV